MVMRRKPKHLLTPAGPPSGSDVAVVDGGAVDDEKSDDSSLVPTLEAADKAKDKSGSSSESDEKSNQESDSEEKTNSEDTDCITCGKVLKAGKPRFKKNKRSMSGVVVRRAPRRGRLRRKTKSC